MAIGPVRVELEGVAKSTWNLNSFSVVEVPSSKKKLGEPAGGAVLPSRSAGSKLASLGPFWKHCIMAALATRIAVRVLVHAFRPVKEPPHRKKLVARR